MRARTSIARRRSIPAIRAWQHCGRTSPRRWWRPHDSCPTRTLRRPRVSPPKRVGWVPSPAALAALERDFDSGRVREQQRRLTQLLEAARERVQNGALFAPLNDSALDYLSRLQADAPELAGLAEAWEEFRQASVLAIQNAIESGEWPLADAQLAGLTPAPGGAAAAAPLAAELAARRLQQTYLAAAAPASELDLRSSVPVVYPSQAIARGIEGWVDLEFVVGTQRATAEPRRRPGFAARPFRRCRTRGGRAVPLCRRSSATAESTNDLYGSACGSRCSRATPRVRLSRAARSTATLPTCSSRSPCRTVLGAARIRRGR